MDEHDRRMAMEPIRAYLARADSELEAALRFLDPRTDEGTERDPVLATAKAKISVGDALDTIRGQLGEW